MDRIKFIVEDHIDREYHFRFPTINIYIDNHNLIDLVEEIEREYEPEQVKGTWKRSYVGLHPDYFRRYEDEFLGLNRPGTSILLICTCLMWECNCVVGKVIVESDTVIWSDMYSPWLSSVTPGPWTSVEEAVARGWRPIDYSGLGPFVFDRKQYMDALEDLRKNFE